MYKIFVLLFFPVLLSCHHESNDNSEIVGLYQSLNDPSRALEFTKSGYYIIYINGNPLIQEIADSSKLKYFYNKSRSQFNLDIFGEKNNLLVVKANLEVVDKNRIRVYIYKHHDILDVADEFYRTDGFNNFEKIIKDLK
jgi:hypothetical protein